MSHYRVSDIVTTRRVITLIVSEQVEPFGQWVVSLSCFSVHSVFSLLNVWVFYCFCSCLGWLCLKLTHIVVLHGLWRFVGDGITCLYPWCLLYHGFQCLVISYQTVHLDNSWSAMGHYGKRSGIQRMENKR